MIYLSFVGIGLLVGVLSGLFGIGGGVVIIPILVYLFKFTQHEAQGTSLAMLLPPIGLLAAWKYWQAGNVQILPAMILASMFAIGALVGAHFAIQIPHLMMKRIFGGFLIAVGVFMLWGK
ncbi:MAG: sulfite exporter TauE/SafE family protein [Pseudomonadota bacterium]